MRPQENFKLLENKDAKARADQQLDRNPGKAWRTGRAEEFLGPAPYSLAGKMGHVPSPKRVNWNLDPVEGQGRKPADVPQHLLVGCLNREAFPRPVLKLIPVRGKNWVGMARRVDIDRLYRQLLHAQEELSD